MPAPQATFPNLTLISCSLHLLGALHNVARVLLHNHVILHVNPFTTSCGMGSSGHGEERDYRKRRKVKTRINSGVQRMNKQQDLYKATVNVAI